MSNAIKPQVHGIFDPATWTVTYVVYEKEGAPCAIIDSVLDYDPKSGRTRTDSADKVIAFVREKNLSVAWISVTISVPFRKYSKAFSIWSRNFRPMVRSLITC